MSGIPDAASRIKLSKTGSAGMGCVLLRSELEAAGKDCC